MGRERELVFVDSDGGFDDLFATCVLLSRPERVQLVGVTTVLGMMLPELSAAAFRRVLAHAGQARVPVQAGAGAFLATDEAKGAAAKFEERPYAGPHSLLEESWGAEYRRDCEKACDAMALPPLSRELLEDGPASWALQQLQKCGACCTPLASADRRAASLLTETVERYPGQVTLVCLGPLTNLARWALAGGPVSRLRKVVIMGGALRCSGNAGPAQAAELNFYSDPLAAHVFLSALHAASRSPTLVGLEVCDEPVCLSPGAREAVLSTPESRTAVGTMARRLVGLHPQACCYDAVVAAWLLEPAVLRTEPVRVSVGLHAPREGALAEEKDAGCLVQIGTGIDAQVYASVLAAVAAS